jgi:hypothetical protein
VTVALFAVGNLSSGLLGGLQFGGGAVLATLATAAGVRTLGGYGLAGV